MSQQRTRGLLRGAIGAVLVWATCPRAIAQPPNDNCDNAEAVSGAAVIPFFTLAATTDGPEPCGSLGADVWFYYDPIVSGSVRLSTCGGGTNFASVISAYRRTTCCDPNDCDLVGLLGCSGAAGGACAPGGSTLRVPVNNRYRVLVQVGGHEGAQGEGELALTPCVGDFDADGVVALADLALLLSEFGECGIVACRYDIEPPGGDGDVDLTDLAVVLGRFGTECP